MKNLRQKTQSTLPRQNSHKPDKIVEAVDKHWFPNSYLTTGGSIFNDKNGKRLFHSNCNVNVFHFSGAKIVDIFSNIT